MHQRATPAFAVATKRRQRGVYALEWAVIFPVFFVLMYGIICYGLTYLVRESMQFAVEEGARAALRYPRTATMGGATTPTWLHRSTEAREATATALNWLPTNIKPDASDIRFTVCGLNDADCDSATELNAALNCDASTPCLVLVSYTIRDYADNAIAPSIPGLGLILPRVLEAKASLLIDRRML